MTATIASEWAQLGGGVRYLVDTPHGEITVDADREGNLSGFVRPGYTGDEEKGLRAAFDTVIAWSARGY